MRIITAERITELVSQLAIQANLVLRSDVLDALRKARKTETNGRAKVLLDAIINNARVARQKQIAVCQDTGLPAVFVELGQGVKISGDINRAINQGIEQGYKEASLRNSIVRDPLDRGKSGFTPAVIHYNIVKGNKLRLCVLPKGFGCENKSQLRMFKPTSALYEIKKFIVEAVRQAGPDACPPYVVGVGIGGTADYACLLAKKALLRKLLTNDQRLTTNDQRPTTKLAQELLRQINKLNIGPMGLGGKTTALAVNIESYPTHIAGLPVAVSISCHALRSAEKII